MAGRILIADPVATNRMILTARLMRAHYRIHAAEGSGEVLAFLRDEVPELMIVDESLCAPDGQSLCQYLKSMEATRLIPIVVLTGRDDTEAGIRALNSGADEFLVKPIDEVALLARVRSLLRAKETHTALNRRRITVEELGFAEPPAAFTPPGRILIVAQDDGLGSAWRDAVRGLIRDTIDVTDINTALDTADDLLPPDLFLIAANGPRRAEGLRLLSDLRSRPETRHAAILVMHRSGDSDTAASALDLGANDVVADGFLPAELAIRLRTQLRRKQDADRLRSSVEDGLRMAVLDPLTGLYNRRYAYTHLGRIAENAARTARPYTIILSDIDRFKEVNDSHGHAIGDAVLIEVSRRLRDRVRDVDLVARVGGEEFLIALPDIDKDGALTAADRLRQAIGERPFPVDGVGALNITVSLGVLVVETPGAAGPISGLIDCADAALYEAKDAGRNTVRITTAGDQRSRRNDWSRRSA